MDVQDELNDSEIGSNEIQVEDGQEMPTYEDGELAPCFVTKSKIWKPEDIKAIDPTLPGVITSMITRQTKSEEIARRISVLETWQSRHFDRGYQYLLNDKGGFGVAGLANGSETNRNSMLDADDAGLYPTNIFAAQGDIITGALNRGTIKVSFSPVDSKSKSPQDNIAAENANKYKHIWCETNKQTELQRTAAGMMWTDPRVLLWTKSMKDKSRYGTTTNEDGSEEIKTVEVTTVHGTLESRIPMLRDCLHDCEYANIYEEVNYSKARTMFPWAKSVISKTATSGAETEFERIARINVRSGLPSKLIIGSNKMNDTTLCYSWQRPSQFEDEGINDQQREFLLKNFTNGLFAIVSNNSLVCCWEESMDDHLSMGMSARGYGQGRRSLGSNDIPLQKRINVWADLWDTYFRGSIPITVLDGLMFNAEAISELNSDPRRFIGAVPSEGQTIQSSIGQTPQAQPLPGFLEMFNMYVGPLIQSIDGATPALFGGGEGQDNTVGATQIRLNQSLERVGPPWIVLNEMFACAIKQAVKCCAENNNSTELSGTYDDEGDISVKPADLKGNIKVKAETINEIPESGTQKEAKAIMLLDMANQNQQLGQLIANPSNAREFVNALHIDYITIDEADSEDKQLEEIQKLLEAEPLINPDWADLQKQYLPMKQKYETAKQLSVQALQNNQQLTPQIQQQAEQLENDVEQLEQQVNSTPQYLSSIPVAQDDSEDHSTEAATCFAWMQGSVGRSLRAASNGKEFGDPSWNKFMNVYLHWQGHKDMIKKITAENAQAPIPKLSLTGKMSPDIINQLAAAAGIQVNPQASQQPPVAEQHVETISRTPFQERKTKTIRKL